MMERVLPYFSFRGRSNRRRYWETGITIFMLFFVAALVVSELSRLPVIGILGALLFFGLIVAALVAVFANGARRLHDRGKSAWWLLVFVLLPTLLSLPSEMAKYGPADDFRLAAAGLAVLGLPFSLWGLVEMGFLKGKAGSNRFGEDPLAPPQEPALA